MTYNAAFRKGGAGGGKGGKPTAGKGNWNQRHYIQCQTIGCNGHVFQQLGTTMPEKCKVCNFCGAKFIIPGIRQQKGAKGAAGGTKGSNLKKDSPIEPLAPTPAAVAPNKITALYETLVEHGCSEEAALEQLTALGLKLPKKVAPKPVDDYGRLIAINRDIKQYQNDIEGQSEKYHRLAQTADELLDIISDKQTKLAELKAEQLALHQEISKSSPEDNTKTSLPAVLQAELEQLSAMNSFIGTQPNVPDQVKQLCSRVEYVKLLVLKTFSNQLEMCEKFGYTAEQEEITSEDLHQVGEYNDDSEWPEGYGIVDLDLPMEAQGRLEGLATASVVSLAAQSGSGNTPPPPPKCDSEYPSYNMANWQNIKKKAHGLDMPRPKASKLDLAPASASAMSSRPTAASSSLPAAKAADE